MDHEYGEPPAYTPVSSSEALGSRRGTLAELEAAAASAQTGHDAFKSTMDDLSAQVTRLKIKRLESEVEDQKEDLERQERELVRLRAALDAARQLSERLHGKLTESEMQRARDRLDRGFRLIELEVKVAEFREWDRQDDQSQIALLQAEAADRKDELDDCKIRNRWLERKVETLERRLLAYPENREAHSGRMRLRPAWA